MKRTLFILGLLLATTHNSEAQYGYTKLGFVPTQNDSTKIEITTTFLLGSGANCPEMKYYSITTGSDTLFISAYYDVSGIWAALGCISVDTVNLGVLPTATKVITVIPYEYTTVPADTYGHAPVSILSSLGVQEKNIGERIVSVFPNPATDHLYIHGADDKVCIISDITGRIVLEKTTVNGYLDIADLPVGASYVLKISSGNTSYITKFMKN